jgi:tetratricopeptide (TPR) repeat protein
MWIMALTFLFAIGTVFANRSDLVNGVVSAKSISFFVAMVTMLPMIPFIRQIKVSMLDLLVFLFGAVVLFIATISGGPLAYTKLILFALLLVLYWLMRCLLTSHPPVAVLLKVVLITTALVECLMGLHQLYGLSPSNHALFRITGSFFNPGPFSGYVGMIVPLALYEVLLFSDKEVRLRTQIKRIITKGKRLNSCALIGKWLVNLLRWLLPYIGGCLSVLTVMAALMVLPAAMSRAAWVGVVAGSLVVFLNYPPVRLKVVSMLDMRRKRLGFTLLVSILVVGAVIGIYHLRPASVDGRMLLWKHGVKAMLDHPLGVGLGKVGAAIGEAQAEFYSANNVDQALIDRSDVPFYAFNEYIQIGVESGVLGLVLFLALMVVVLMRAYKNKQYGVMGALVSLSVFAFFSYPFSVLPFIIVLVTLLALGQVRQADETVHQASKVVPVNPVAVISKQQLLRSLPVSLVCMGVIVACLINRYPTLQAWRDWKEDKMLINAGLFEDAAESMKPLYPYLNDQPEFLFDYARSLSKAGRFEESNQVLERCMAFSGDPMLYNVYGKNLASLHRYEDAISTYEQAYNRVPNRLYPLYLLARLYVELGDTLGARQTAEKLYNHTVIAPSRAIEEMKDSLRVLVATMPHGQQQETTNLPDYESN